MPVPQPLHAPLRALKDNIHLLAKLKITQTADEIVLSARQRIVLNGGGSYLIAVKGRTAKVINRDFGGCGKSYEVIREGTDLGYRVKEQDAATSTRYLLRGGALVEEKMVSREMSRQ